MLGFETGGGTTVPGIDGTVTTVVLITVVLYDFEVVSMVFVKVVVLGLLIGMLGILLGMLVGMLEGMLLGMLDGMLGLTGGGGFE